MDEETLKTMPDYVQKLPQKVRDLVFDGVWEEKVGEIAVKYSLNESQTDTFINKVLFVLIGLENPDNFLGSLIYDLDISELLAEQIMKEADVRVFQYAFEFVSKPSGPSLPLPKLTNDSFGILNSQKEEVEIAPVILPMVESEKEREKVMAENKFTGVAPANLPGVPIETLSRVPLGENAPRGTLGAEGQTQDGRFVGSEFAQKPISVPRFNVATAPEPSIPPKPQNIVEQKPEIQNPPRYTNDPYREPIE